MNNSNDRLNQVEIALLQLQRSALIDIQTVIQVLIDKGLCTVDDIVQIRSKIESDSEDIKRIDKQIIDHGGVVTVTPIPGSITNKADLKKQLNELHALLEAITKETHK